MTILIAYILVGIVAGLLAGLLGVGGGLVIVPALYYVFHTQLVAPELIMHLAVGSSLATIVFTSLTSIYAHHRHHAVLWTCAAKFLPGIVLGAGLGALLAGHLPTRELKICFAVFELLVAVQLALNLRPSAHRSLPGITGMWGAGTVIGGVSALLGIGGGTLTVPFLLWCNIGIREAVATSAACGFPIAVAGALGFAATGWNIASLPGSSTGYLYWPAILSIASVSMLTAPLGARLTHTLPVTTLKRSFALVLAIVGVRLLF
jgi:uncharacterized protein